MRDDDEIVLLDPQQTTAEMDEIVDIADLDVQRRRGNKSLAPIGAVGQTGVDVLQQREQLGDAIDAAQPLWRLTAIAIPKHSAQHRIGEDHPRPDAVGVEIQCR